jgi:hypothetical protein
MELYHKLGPKWGAIGAELGNRAGPDIKNRFQSVRHKLDEEHRSEKRRRKRLAKLAKQGQIVGSADDLTSQGSAAQLQSADDPATDKNAEKQGVHGPVDFSIKNLLA